MHEVLPPVRSTWEPLTATDPRTPQKRTSMSGLLVCGTPMSLPTCVRANTRPAPSADLSATRHPELHQGGSPRAKVDRAAMLRRDLGGRFAGSVCGLGFAGSVAAREGAIGIVQGAVSGTG